MMIDDLRDLYQDVILDHGRNPRNLRQPEHANRQALGRNPTCGDALVVYLEVGEDGLVRDIGFRGQGCAISMASASMMTEILTGKTVKEARRLFGIFHAMATGEEPDPAALDGLDEDDLDRLTALSGVRQFPVRVKCATLAWHTMTAAVDGSGTVSTEE